MATPVAKRSNALAGNQDTSFLKMLALVFMLVDHLGVVIFPKSPEMRVIGRMALPLYAWCLVVGSQKTRSMPRYCLRMLSMALISQPLYMLALNHKWADLNILFLLLLGLVAIWGIQARFLLSQVWAPALCYLALGYLKMDYGWKGLCTAIVPGARQQKRLDFCLSGLRPVLGGVQQRGYPVVWLPADLFELAGDWTGAGRFFPLAGHDLAVAALDCGTYPQKLACSTLAGLRALSVASHSSRRAAAAVRHAPFHADSWVLRKIPFPGLLFCRTCDMLICARRRGGMADAPHSKCGGKPCRFKSDRRYQQPLALFIKARGFLVHISAKKTGGRIGRLFVEKSWADWKAATDCRKNLRGVVRGITSLMGFGPTGKAGRAGSFRQKRPPPGKLF